MLQLNTVNKSTFLLLKELSANNFLSNFALAGGTSLSLQLGHRISIDLDFFTLKEFSPEEVLIILKEIYKIDDAIINKNSLTLNIKFDKKFAIF